MKQKNNNSQPRRKSRHNVKPRAESSGAAWYFGKHAVAAILENPKRRIDALLATANAARDLENLAKQRGLSIAISSGGEIARKLVADAVHQGIAVQARPLEQFSLQEFCENLSGSLVVVLDQVTDPHNVGAILRTATAFGASALIMTQRNSPPLSGTLAKAACGGLEHVPVIPVSNLARALDDLAGAGFWRIGLDGDAEMALERFQRSGPVALVLGAEGKGLRRLTREHCDQLCSITTSGALTSLNVSNAAAIALHTLAI